MKINSKWLFVLLAFGLVSCGPLPFNGIVTITPEMALIQTTPTSTPFTVAPTLPPETPTTAPLPLPVTNTPVPTLASGTQMPPAVSTPATAVLQDMVEKARLDLAKRLSISDADITLVQASQVDWADLSLGCPKPGMLYGQMVTPGYLVVLRAGSTLYQYHSGPGQNPFFCSSPQAPIQVNPGTL